MFYPVSPLTQNQQERWMFQIVWKVIKVCRCCWESGDFDDVDKRSWIMNMDMIKTEKYDHVFKIPLQRQKVA